MIIDCISDLHGFLPKLEGGDLLIVAGDVTATDTIKQHLQFYSWLHAQNYKKFIVVGGNHDNLLQTGDQILDALYQTTYLCDSGTEFEGLKIWGSPWTKSFAGMNPKCKAFVVDTEQELLEKFSLIPKDTDILVTHSPAWGVLDTVGRNRYAGSVSLHDLLKYELSPKLHVFGHVHESYGRTTMEFLSKRDEDEKVVRKMYEAVNASYVNEHYRPVNKPIRIQI